MTLSDAYHLALKTSEQVQIAGANRDLAETSYTGALTIMGPTIGLYATGWYQNAAEATVSVDSGGNANQGRVQNPFLADLRAQATLPLIRAQIFAARRAARLGIAGAEQQLRQAHQQLMIDVATLFIGVLQARQQVTIAQGAVKRADTQVTSAKNRVKVGGALPTAELLAQIDLNRAQTQLNTASGMLRNVESQFQRYVGQAPPASLLLPATPKTDALADALDESGSKRADLHALRLSIDQAQATLSSLKAKLFTPTLDATGYLGGIFKAAQIENGPSVIDWKNYGVAWNLAIPLFQTGDEWIQVKLQRSRVAQSISQASFLKRQISDAVRQANASLETAKKAIEIANTQQTTANQNYNLVANHYKLGVASILDLVTAQSAIFEAETNKALASYQLELATYQLLFAEGKIDL